MDDEELLQVLEKMASKRALMLLGGTGAGMSTKKFYTVKGLYDANF